MGACSPFWTLMVPASQCGTWTLVHPHRPVICAWTPHARVVDRGRSIDCCIRPGDSEILHRLQGWNHTARQRRVGVPDVVFSLRSFVRHEHLMGLYTPSEEGERWHAFVHLQSHHLPDYRLFTQDSQMLVYGDEEGTVYIRDIGHLDVLAEATTTVAH
ncbi:hypothetical protein C8Q74DRAFT_514421 [Fomes fomentarius]|nr:hypothetical protein C8Q74DRAFT_514421 [Fomes fomentarius]